MGPKSWLAPIAALLMVGCSGIQQVPQGSQTPSQPSLFSQTVYAALWGCRSVAVLDFDAAAGFLEERPGSPFNTGSEGLASSLAIDPERHLLFVSNSQWIPDRGEVQGRNELVVMRIDSGGELVRQGTPVPMTIHSSLATSPDGRLLYTSQFAPGVFSPSGFVLYEVDSTSASLKRLNDEPEPPASWNFRKDPLDRFLFALGDPVQVFRIADDRKPIPVENPAFSAVPNFLRDLQVHPSGRYVYVSGNGSPAVAGFHVDNEGKLVQVEQPENIRDGSWMAVDPLGRYLFVMHLTGIWTFALDPQNGGLTLVSDTPLRTSSSPSSGTVDLSGSFLITSTSNGFELYRIDRATGELQFHSAQHLPGTCSAYGTGLPKYPYSIIVPNQK